MIVAFVDEAWKLLVFPYPTVAARRGHTAKEGVHRAISSYVQSSSNSPINATAPMHRVLKGLKTADVDDSEVASIAFFYLWA